MILGRQPALWIEVIRMALVLAILFGLNLTKEQLAQAMALLGAIALLLTNGSVTSNAKLKDNDIEHKALKLVPFAIAGALLLGAHAASAGTLPWASIDRLAGGVTLQASVYSNRSDSTTTAPLAAFCPKAYLDYSLLDEVSAHASFQMGVGQVRVNELRYGGSVRILREDPVRVSVGVDVVRYSGPDAGLFATKKATEYSLRFSKVLKRAAGAPRLGLQFQPAYVPENQNFVYRLGLNAPLFGGKPLATGEEVIPE